MMHIDKIVIKPTFPNSVEVSRFIVAFLELCHEHQYTAELYDGDKVAHLRASNTQVFTPQVRLQVTAGFLTHVRREIRKQDKRCN